MKVQVRDVVVVGDTVTEGELLQEELCESDHVGVNVKVGESVVVSVEEREVDSVVAVGVHVGVGVFVMAHAVVASRSKWTQRRSDM